MKKCFYRFRINENDGNGIGGLLRGIDINGLMMTDEVNIV